MISLNVIPSTECPSMNVDGSCDTGAFGGRPRAKDCREKCRLHPLAPKIPWHLEPDDEIFLKRMSSCFSCEHRMEEISQRHAGRLIFASVRCNACTPCEGGRSLTARAQSCPIGKW